MARKKTSRDIFSTKKRSEIMSRVRSKDTLLEKEVFKVLKQGKIKFKTHYGKVLGKPDIVNVSKKRTVFIDSDFWHGWRYPVWKKKLTSDFWVKKIDQNRKRDRFVSRTLRRQGWAVLRVWEHQLKKDREETIKKIIGFLS